MARRDDISTNQIMQNGHSEPHGLLERVRNEVRKRKLALEPGAPHLPGSDTEVSPAISAAPPSVVITPQASAAPLEEKPRLKRARVALDRASSKNASAPGWPRFLRRLRRNQGAINEALIQIAAAFLETLEWLHKKMALLDLRFADLSKGSQEQRRQLQQQLDLRARQIAEQDGRADTLRKQLAELDQKLEQQARRATEDEVAAAQLRRQLLELEGRLERSLDERQHGERRLDERAVEQQKQILDLNYKLLAYQTEVGARFERTVAQQLLSERQLIDVQSLVRDLEKQTAHEQLQLAEFQEFVHAQHQQNTENAGLLGKQQEQLTAVRVQFAQQQKQLDEMSGQLIENQNDACARYHLTIEALEQEKRRVAEIRRRIEELHPGALPESSFSSEIEALRNKLNTMQASFAIIQGYFARTESTETVEAVGPAVSKDLKEHDKDAFYLAFENQFRGDRELIKDRLRFYLPIMERTKATTGNISAVDLGCGRGEWLELLREQGYEGVGVDVNLCMIEECRSRGLKAESADAIAYLRNLAPGSLSLVTGFHIVEHLSFSQLLDVFRETFRVLCPRGTAIFETPNPENSHVSGYSFYLDPTHRNPIPQELLCFAARQTGFESTQVERLQAFLEDGVFKGYLDYAGIFTK
jgi:SAM-dependent methyltransferase